MKLRHPGEPSLVRDWVYRDDIAGIGQRTIFEICKSYTSFVKLTHPLAEVNRQLTVLAA
jgi:hypothetical protein